MPSTVRRARPPEAALDLGAVALRDRLAAGALKAADLAEAAIARIEATEPEIRAWAWFDPEFVRAQAKALDAHRATGRPVGPLHGVPVGLKDIIDTARIPTENGTAIDAGRVPREDAFVVARLKAAGALILGKTATTELAFFTPAPTRNPADPAHTPGGSSAGSAAAVAAGQAPLAVGTQTAGSVIRPAAFCGVVGFKPSFGAIPRTGILAQSPSLDTVGVFARTRPGRRAPRRDALRPRPARPRDRARAAAAPARDRDRAAAAAPVFAFVRPPGWDEADPDTRAALEELAAQLGEQCFEAPLPGAFAQAAEIRERVNLAELAKCYHRYERRGRDALSGPLRAAIDARQGDPRPRLHRGARLAGGAERRARGDPRPLRRDPGAGGAGAGARGARLDGQPDLQRPLDALRHALGDDPGASGLERPADGRAAHRPARRRRPAAAHRALADGAHRRQSRRRRKVTDQLMRAVAFAALVGFLGVLVYWVPRIDLTAVILVTLALAAYDLFLAGSAAAEPQRRKSVVVPRLCRGRRGGYHDRASCSRAGGLPVSNPSPMRPPRSVAREISYASSARTRAGRAVIRSLENITGRLRLIRMARDYDVEVAEGRDFWEVMVERYGLSLEVTGGSLDEHPRHRPADRDLESPLRHPRRADAGAHPGRAPAATSASSPTACSARRPSSTG